MAAALLLVIGQPVPVELFFLLIYKQRVKLQLQRKYWWVRLVGWLVELG